MNSAPLAPVPTASPSTAGPGPDFADATVIMPALNRAGIIGRALDSIAAQELPPAEVVVIDDGSTDATAEVARAHGARVLSLPTNRGTGPARNAGIETVTTGWVAFLDSDDEWLPGHLRHLVAHSAGRVLVSAAALTTGGRLLGNTSAADADLDPVRMLVPGDLVVTSGALVATDALRAVGAFRSVPGAEDLDLWLRILERGPGISLGGTPTLRYHEHGEQVSKDHDIMRQGFDQTMRTYADRPWLTPSVWARSYGRVHWDELRAAQRTRDVRGLAGQLGWFARHPAGVPAVVELLRQRRRARVRVTSLV
jgi:hypothetical protein